MKYRKQKKMVKKQKLADSSYGTPFFVVSSVAYFYFIFAFHFYLMHKSIYGLVKVRLNCIALTVFFFVLPNNNVLTKYVGKV